MFEKHLWKCDILSKDAARWHFASKNQLPGLSVNGTLVAYGLRSKNGKENFPYNPGHNIFGIYCCSTDLTRHK